MAIASALVAATFLVYLPTHSYDFLNWDDQSYVVDNDYVKAGVSTTSLAWAFTHSHSANWHPLTWISHMLDCQVYGLQPGKHHLTNVLLHSFNAALLFAVLLLLTESNWRSALVAAIFALHPLRVESVAWISERKDELSLFFGLLSLLAYGTYARTATNRANRSTRINLRSEKSAIAKLPPWRWLAAALFLFGLGLLSKPMLVTWPFVMLLLDYWPLQRIQLGASQSARVRWRWLVLEKSPFIALSIASSVVTILAQKRAGAVATFSHLPLEVRFQNAMTAYLDYIKKLFWPTNLSPIYPYSIAVETWHWAIATGLIIGFTGFAWHWRGRLPFVFVGWLWFLGTLVPVIGIVQVGSQAMADRYTYIPLIGLVWMLVWLAALFANTVRLPKLALTVASAILLAGLTWRTTAQLKYWRNTETLFRHTLALWPKNAQALFGLGSYLVAHGRTEEGKKLLERLVQLRPDYAEALGTLASVFDNEGRYDKAVDYYQRALGVQPNQAALLNNFAWLRAACPDPSVRDGTEAVLLATKACELTGYGKPLFIGTLAAAQAETGQFRLAVRTAEQAVALATSLGLADTVSRNQDLIILYRSGKAAYGSAPEPK